MAMITQSEQTAITKLYVGLLNRAPDASGLTFWAQALADGVSLPVITQSLVSSPETTTLHPMTQTSAQFISTFYQSVFGRTVDAGGLAFWTSFLDASGAAGSAAAKAALISQIIGIVSTPLTIRPSDLSDAQYAQTIADRSNFAKKVEVGLAFATVTKSDDLTLAKAALANIFTPATPSTPDSPQPQPQIFTLTTGADTFAGGNANDIFNSAAGTLQASDVLDGGAGSDTLNVILAPGVNVTPTVRNIEVVTVRSNDPSSVLNLSSATGVTEVGVVDSPTQTRVYGVGNAALSVVNQTSYTMFSGSTATALSLNLKNVGSAGDSPFIDLASQGTGALATTFSIVTENAYVGIAQTVASAPVLGLTIAASGTNVLDFYSNAATVKSLAVNGTGSVNLGDRTLLALTSLKVTGNVAVTLSVSGENIETLSTGSGNDSIVVFQNALASDARIDLGAGDDTLYLSATPTAGAIIDGGAGRDTLRMLSATPNYATINAVTNFEVLAVEVAGATIDLNQITSVNEFLVTSSGMTNFANAKNGASFNIDNSYGVNGVTLNGTTVSNASITLNNASTTPRLSSINTANFESVSDLSLTSSGTGTNANKINSLVLNTGATLTIKGAADLNVTLAGNPQNITVDAASFTGKLILTGTNSADVLKGGKGADTLTGNGGDDSFIVESTAITRGSAFAAADTSVANIDRITDFVGNDGAAGDQIRLGLGGEVFGAGITFTGATTAIVTAVTVASAADFNALTAAIQLANPGVASTSATAQIYDVTITSGNLAGRYVVLNDGTNTISMADMIISITGITGVLNEQDFTFA